MATIINRRLSTKNRNMIIVGLILIILIIVLVIFRIKHKPSSVTSSSSSASTSQANANPNKQQPPPATSSSNSQAQVVTPFGTFVSNHHPNLSGSPAPNSMQSTCRTTPQISCDITFTKDGVTKSLGQKTTDSSGTASWSWKLQDVGLTQGEWQITAVATNGNDTKTSSDQLKLVVGP